MYDIYYGAGKSKEQPTVSFIGNETVACDANIEVFGWVIFSSILITMQMSSVWTLSKSRAPTWTARMPNNRDPVEWLQTITIITT